MRLPRTLISAVIDSLLAVGCADKKAEGADSAVAAMQSTQEVTTLGGRVTIKIPADLQPLLEQEGMGVYMNDKGGVTVMAGDSPGGDSAALMEMTMNNLKLKDPNLKVLGTGETQLGEQAAKTVDVQMKSDGKDVHMTMALTTFDNKLFAIQVLGEQSKGDEVSKTAKAVFDSVKISK